MLYFVQFQQPLGAVNRTTSLMWHPAGISTFLGKFRGTLLRSFLEDGRSIMKIWQAIFFLFNITLLFGCTTSEKYGKLLDTWLGESEEALVSAWGPPQSLYVSPAGDRILTYASESQVFLPGTTSPSTTYISGYQSGGYFSGTATTYNYSTPPTMLNYSCVTHFTLRQGRIVNWRYEGNNCVSNYDDSSTQVKTKQTQKIDVSPTDTSAVRQASLDVVYVKYDKASLRSRPGLNEEVVDVTSASTPLKSIQENDYWIKVRTPSGKEGWIAKSWLKSPVK